MIKYVTFKAFFVCIVFNVIEAHAQIRFEDVTESAGLLEPLKGMMGHNAIWGDIDNNGYPDLFFGTFTHFKDSLYNERGHKGGKQPNKLFLNNGDGTFDEVTDSPVKVKGKNSGGAFADFDNDGDLDLVLSHQAHLKVWPNDLPEAGIQRNLFLENDGFGNLTDITERTGLDFGYPFLGRSTFVFDYDGDGLLDIFMQEDFALGDISGGNFRLMKNMGGLVFIDVTSEAGFPSGFQKGLYGLGGTVDDLNGDSWPDVFFAHSSRLFINNQDGTFHENKFQFVDKKYTKPSSVNLDWTCGASSGDIDNDGDMDLVMGDHFKYDEPEHYLYLFLNEGNDENGDPIYRNISKEAKIVDPDGRLIHMQLEDIDNDGRLDILTSKCNSFIYRNAGMENNIPVFEKPIDAGVKCGIGYWAGGPFSDFDRDGRLDFIGPEWESRDMSPLLRNVTKDANNYIDIKLDLINSKNRNGIGAKVEIYKAGFLNKKEGLLGTDIISVSNGYSSAYEAIAHFGLPNDEVIDLKVTMPNNGKVYTKTAIPRNQLFILKE